MTYANLEPNAMLMLELSPKTARGYRAPISIHMYVSSTKHNLENFSHASKGKLSNKQQNSNPQKSSKPIIAFSKIFLGNYMLRFAT
jgi:hypothetical protein